MLCFYNKYMCLYLRIRGGEWPPAEDSLRSREGSKERAAATVVLELTSYAATITSALLFAFTGDFLANRKLFSRFLLFIAYECLLVAVKVAYQLLRDTPPFEVKLQRKRVNFLGRKIVADEPDERKEDSDDESEEDEARHPLIVHDRDPEQNLEALRDPSRFRQNLA